MKTIIIVCTLAMMQGFLDAYVPESQCAPELKKIFDNLGVDFEYIQNIRGHVDESIYSIFSLISHVQVNIAISDTEGTDCFKQLSERLDEIYTSYQGELRSYYLVTALNTDIGRRLQNCFNSLGNCIEKAPKCSDTPSCITDCENILYGDDTLNDRKIDAYLRGLESGFTKECEKIIDKVNAINATIPSC